MARDYIRLKGTDHCPVCGDNSGKCRQKGDSEKILCMSLPHGEGAGNGYRYLGPNKNPLWGDYVPVGDYDPEKTRQNAIERAARERELERQHRETSLSATVRDTEIKKILQNLTLSKKHREYLEGRAIPVVVIVNCRSVTQWQRIEEAHVKVPGVNRQGDGLLNGWDGIVIPAQNAKGEFTALRSHDPNAKVTGNPKYAVLSGNCLLYTSRRG
mgnify:FL=1